jgi:hypothetical protein
MKLTQARLKELLHYDPETGLFTWRVTLGSRAKAGALAGSFCCDTKYIKIRIKGMLYYAHRLAFIYMTGALPLDQIDHINAIRHDNRWSNIREATSAQNKQNRKIARRDNKSTGVLGVSRNCKRFQAKIKTNGNVVCLGTFDTTEQASAAYIEAKRKFHTHGTL